MKIRLVEPKSKSHNVYDHSRLPRLGLPQIGARLVEHGHDVKIYVESLAPIDVDDLLSADLVGFSTTTGTTPPAYELADRLREQGRPVVFGGAHVTFLPDEGLQHADYVVLGEGHTAMPRKCGNAARAGDATCPGPLYSTGVSRTLPSWVTRIIFRIAPAPPSTKATR